MDSDSSSDVYVVLAYYLHEKRYTEIYGRSENATLYNRKTETPLLRHDVLHGRQ